MDSITSALKEVAANKGHICGSLYYLRSKISNKSEGINELRDHGGIKILVKCLKQVNPKVLSLSLSILGNCSMDAACREQLLECGIMKDLSVILKNINVDSIVNRTCRMIANLSESQAHIPLMHKHNIPSTIVNILENSLCDTTRYSAIRAIRKIWENSSKLGCLEMVKCQAPYMVSKFLKSKCKPLLTVVLRAIMSFLSKTINAKQSAINRSVVNQILGNNNEISDTIRNLMSLLSEYPIISRIIYLICHVKNSIQMLHETQIITQIVDVLKKENNVYLMVSLCKLLEGLSFRAELFNIEDGVSFFLNFLSSTDAVQKTLVLTALLQFQFNSNLLRKMVSKGLIQILINNLISSVQKHRIDHLQSELRCKPPTDTLSFDNSASPAGSSSMSPNIPMIEDWSPTMDDNIITNSYSPCYSPVCESFDNESINSDESNSDISDYEENVKIDILLPENSANTIIQMLSRLCYLDNVIQMIADKKVWEAILYYIQFMKGKFIMNAINILEQITAATMNFNTILTNGFILLTHIRLCRPFHELDCQYCEERNKLGMKIIENSIKTFESKFAQQVIDHMMNNPDTSNVNYHFIMKVISLTIPHVIRNHSNLLLVMLSKHKMYVTMCNIIRDERNIMYNDAVAAIMALFKTTNIIYQTEKIERCKDQNCHKKIINRETTVTFELDDGTLINANKSFLSLKSPVFEAMFRCGGFKEAYQNIIRLNDVSSECFKSFVQLLDINCDCLMPRTTVVLLELIMIADRYMLHELSEKIIKVMINSITLNICLDIYMWVRDIGYQLKNGNDIGNCVIKYLFTSNARFLDRVKTIKSITRSDYGEVFIEDFTTMLKVRLSCLSNNDNVSKFYLSEFSCK